ncbi:protein pxr1 [Podospora aff. communis PSN243]|uniref:Protein pxr1 n=1 Tax=Podospora aff. communis PSN243 TaxID=3040156 RepID=A0AAV9GS10_9PEZI|nr:protein pxr1 [Podospora aff. communis PSN243]
MAPPSQPAEPAEEDKYDYDVETPLERIRPFGTLHRKQITFVPASGNAQLNSTDATAAPKPHQDVANIYLSMVLPEDVKPPDSKDEKNAAPPTLCEVCNLPMDSLAPQDPQSQDGPPRTATPHENSLAHQLCLPHSHPPSALDRSRMGLNYLSTHGWDPDARRGLGFEQQGIQYPVKTKVKEDRLGIGMEVPKNQPVRKKETMLDAKKVRKMAEEEKKRAARIRQQLFMRDDLEKYFGPGAG